MAEITSELLEVTVDTDHTVEIDSKLPEVVVDTAKSITVEIQPENYVLTSGGMYTGNMTGATPTWLLNAIEQQLTTGDGNIMSVLDAMQTLLNNVQLGVNQAISQIENTNVSMSALETSLGSRIGNNEAAILDVYATRVTATEAQAIATTAIGTTFGGNVDAYIGNLASVYTSPGSATATNIATLQVSYNDQTARIDTVEEISIGQDNRITNIETTITTLDSDVGIMLADLQKQIDGSISTYFYDYAPTILNEPALSWVTEADKLAHIGDLFYDRLTGYGYRFAYEDIIDDPDMGVIYSWIQITDIDVVLALANASTAQATADGKRTVFYRNTLPVAQVINGTTVPLEKGDLWVNSDTYVTRIAVIDNPTTLGHWGDITNTNTENALLAISTLEETNDGVVNTFYQGSAPTTGMTYGDWWIETDTTPIRSYRYEGENGKNVGVVSWVYKDPTTNILANAMVTSDTAKVKIDQVVSGTLAIDITNATVDGTAIGTYVANEIDKEVVILSGTATPTTAPTTPVGKLNDIYLQKGTVTGASGIVVDVVNTWKHNGTIWVAIGNNDNLIALADLTDGKRTIYSNAAENVPNIAVQLNDMWIPSTTANGYNANEVYLYKGLSLGWVIATKYTDDTAADGAQVTANAKSQILYSAVAPTVLTHPLLDIGDQWVDTANGLVKVWSGTAWVDVVAKSTAEVLQQLADLEEARDGSVVIYYETSTTIPIGMTYGDYLVDTDSLSGSSYTVYRYENATGGSSGTLAWHINTGETAKALSSGYRAQVLAGTAQSTADGKVKTWYQISAPTGLTANDVGDIWIDTDNANKMQVWSGTAWKDPTSAQGTTAYNWSANASKLITGPDGGVTGWSFGNGSNVQSYFKVNATNFSISDGTTGYTPFSITGSDINFLGKVSFSSVTGAPTHTSGLLSARPLTAVLGSTYTATDVPLEPVLYTYTSTGWIQGGDPDALTAADLGPAGTTTIDGGRITTGTLNANLVNVTNLNASNIKAGVIYNTGGSAADYSMKIDLNNGVIHIK